MRQGCHGSKLRVVCLYEIHSPESDCSPTDSIAKNQMAMQPESPKNRVWIASNRRGARRSLEIPYRLLPLDLRLGQERRNEKHHQEQRDATGADGPEDLREKTRLLGRRVRCSVGSWES